MRVNVVVTALHQRFIYVTHCQNGAKFNIIAHAVTFTHSATANKLYQRLNNNHKICCDYQLAVDFSIAFFNSRSALQGSQQILSIFAKFAFASSIFPS